MHSILASVKKRTKMFTMRRQRLVRQILVMLVCIVLSNILCLSILFRFKEPRFLSILRNRSFEPVTDVLLYNRVPKTGSGTLQKLMVALGHSNGYFYKDSILFHKRHRNPEELQDLVEYMSTFPRPVAFDRHVHYVDFESFGQGNPIYINMIRDPVERFTSLFWWRRHQKRKATYFRDVEMAEQEPESINETETIDEWFDKDLNKCILEEDFECHWEEGSIRDFMVSYFCGQDDICVRYGDTRALPQALENIDKKYAVVGLSEYFEETLGLLEITLPQYFKGAKALYHSLPESSRSEHKTEWNTTSLRSNARSKLKKMLHFEYEFYYYCRQKFFSSLIHYNLSTF